MDSLTWWWQRSSALRALACLPASQSVPAHRLTRSGDAREVGAQLRQLREAGIVEKVVAGPPATWRITAVCHAVLWEAARRQQLDAVRGRGRDRRLALLSRMRAAEQLWEWADTLSVAPSRHLGCPDWRAAPVSLTFNSVARILCGLRDQQLLITTSTPGWPPCSPVTVIGRITDIEQYRDCIGPVGTPEQEFQVRIDDNAFIHLSRLMFRGATWSPQRAELKVRQGTQLVEFISDD